MRHSVLYAFMLAGLLSGVVCQSATASPSPILFASSYIASYSLLSGSAQLDGSTVKSYDATSGLTPMFDQGPSFSITGCMKCSSSGTFFSVSQGSSVRRVALSSTSGVGLLVYMSSDNDYIRLLPSSLAFSNLHMKFGFAYDGTFGTVWMNGEQLSFNTTAGNPLGFTGFRSTMSIHLGSIGSTVSGCNGFVSDVLIYPYTIDSGVYDDLGPCASPSPTSSKSASRSLTGSRTPSQSLTSSISESVTLSESVSEAASASISEAADSLSPSSSVSVSESPMLSPSLTRDLSVMQILRECGSQCGSTHPTGCFCGDGEDSCVGSALICSDISFDLLVKVPLSKESLIASHISRELGTNAESGDLGSRYMGLLGAFIPQLAMSSMSHTYLAMQAFGQVSDSPSPSASMSTSLSSTSSLSKTSSPSPSESMFARVSTSASRSRDSFVGISRSPSPSSNIGVVMRPMSLCNVAKLPLRHVRTHSDCIECLSPVSLGCTSQLCPTIQGQICDLTMLSHTIVSSSILPYVLLGGTYYPYTTLVGEDDVVDGEDNELSAHDVLCPVNAPDTCAQTFLAHEIMNGGGFTINDDCFGCVFTNSTQRLRIPGTELGMSNTGFAMLTICNSTSLSWGLYSQGKKTLLKDDDDVEPICSIVKAKRQEIDYDCNMIPSMVQASLPRGATIIVDAKTLTKSGQIFVGSDDDIAFMTNVVVQAGDKVFTESIVIEPRDECASLPQILSRAGFEWLKECGKWYHYVYFILSLLTTFGFWFIFFYYTAIGRSIAKCVFTIVKKIMLLLYRVTSHTISWGLKKKSEVDNQRILPKVVAETTVIRRAKGSSASFLNSLVFVCLIGCTSCCNPIPIVTSISRSCGPTSCSMEGSFTTTLVEPSTNCIVMEDLSGKNLGGFQFQYSTASYSVGLQAMYQTAGFKIRRTSLENINNETLCVSDALMADKYGVKGNIDEVLRGKLHYNMNCSQLKSSNNWCDTGGYDHAACQYRTEMANTSTSLCVCSGARKERKCSISFLGIQSGCSTKFKCSLTSLTFIPVTEIFTVYKLNTLVTVRYTGKTCIVDGAGLRVCNKTIYTAKPMVFTSPAGGSMTVSSVSYSSVLAHSTPYVMIGQTSGLIYPVDASAPGVYTTGVGDVQWPINSVISSTKPFFNPAIFDEHSVWKGASSIVAFFGREDNSSRTPLPATVGNAEWAPSSDNRGLVITPQPKYLPSLSITGFMNGFVLNRMISPIEATFSPSDGSTLRVLGCYDCAGGASTIIKVHCNRDGVLYLTGEYLSTVSIDCQTFATQTVLTFDSSVSSFTTTITVSSRPDRNDTIAKFTAVASLVLKDYVTTNTTELEIDNLYFTTSQSRPGLKISHNRGSGLVRFLTYVGSRLVSGIFTFLEPFGMLWWGLSWFFSVIFWIFALFVGIYILGFVFKLISLLRSKRSKDA